MDFELPEDIRLLRDTVRKFVDRELIPIEMHSMDGPELKPEYKKSLEAKARELGLWQLDTPAEFGGQGLSLLALAVVWEEVHRSIALPNRGDGVFGPSPRPILLRLPEKMKEKYLYPSPARREVGRVRADRAGGRQRSRPHEDARRAPWRPLRHQRLQALHLARQGRRFLAAGGRDRSGKGIARRSCRCSSSIWIRQGLSIVRENHHMMGDVTYEIALDDVKVPVENLVGEEGQGMREAQSWISRNRVHQATHGLGVTQRCLEMIGKYAQERVTFGEPLAKRQAVQFAVADLYTKYQVGQLLTHRTAWKVDKGIASRHDAYMCKIFCTELGFEAADRCIQFHGAMGLTTEMPIEAMWRRSRSYLITGGPAEIMRATLAREVFKIYQ